MQRSERLSGFYRVRILCGGFVWLRRMKFTCRDGARILSAINAKDSKELLNFWDTSDHLVITWGLRIFSGLVNERLALEFVF